MEKLELKKFIIDTVDTVSVNKVSILNDGSAT